jgi:hypothetical protein
MLSTKSGVASDSYMFFGLCFASTMDVYCNIGKGGCIYIHMSLSV